MQRSSRFGHSRISSREIQNVPSDLKMSVSLAIDSNLARELTDRRWHRKLKDELGLDFVVCGADRWHDYREVDCVAAVRGLRTLRLPSQARNKTLQCLAGGSSLYWRDGFGLRGGWGARSEFFAGIDP